METQTPIRIHVHNNNIIIDNGSGTFPARQISALSNELRYFTQGIRYRRWPVPRLVYPDGTCVNESDGKKKRAYV